MIRNLLIGAACFFLGALALAFGQATGLRPDQFVGLPWVWSGAQTFTQVQGSFTTTAATTYSFTAADCGMKKVFTANSAVTATIPAAIAPAAGISCNIAVEQFGNAKVSVNGSAVTPAALLSANGYTGTSGVAGAVIVLSIDTISGTPTATLLGNGS